VIPAGGRGKVGVTPISAPDVVESKIRGEVTEDAPSEG
jgi:hypothetical protein